MRDVITTPAPALAAALLAAGHSEPVLVIADNAAIASHAPAWARSFAAVGWRHRVRLSDGPADDVEADAIACEARQFNAHTIVAVGGQATREAARAAAVRAGMPCCVLAD